MSIKSNSKVSGESKSEAAVTPKIFLGEVRNPLDGPALLVGHWPKYRQVIVEFPSRLDCMSLDPSLLDVNDRSVYTAGQLDFSVAIFRSVKLSARNDKQIVVTPKSGRYPLVIHAAMLMQKALSLNIGFNIEYNEEGSLRHSGLGSSSALISAVAVAINELYGNPISLPALVKYLAQNHGEEIDNDPEHLVPVQSLGGSAACGTHDGGLLVIAGESRVIAKMEIPETYSVVLGVPEKFKSPDSEELLRLEIDHMKGFTQSGNNFGKEIAYRFLHETLPAIAEGNLRKIGELIFDYRFNMGSIKNCSFVYPPIVEMANKLKPLFEEEHADILSMSSVGPGMFVITNEPEYCLQRFKEAGFKTSQVKVFNQQYKLTRYEK